MLMVAGSAFIYMPSEVYFPVQQDSSLSQGAYVLFKPPVAKMKNRIEKCVAAEPCF